jgi:hypothetical protein
MNRPPVNQFDSAFLEAILAAVSTVGPETRVDQAIERAITTRWISWVPS